jgi:ABC-type nitrate/sulfonate/bicarbonate transport system ATPase subunit
MPGHRIDVGQQARRTQPPARSCRLTRGSAHLHSGSLGTLSTRDVLNEELIRIWQSKETRLTTVLMVTHSIPEAVTMSDRVIVLSSRPARLVEDIAVPCSRPRTPEDVDTGVIIRRVRTMVRGDR